MNDNKKNILREIGYYFWEVESQDYKRTFNLLKQIDIKEFKIKRKFPFLWKKNVYISAARPGLFIGLKGRHIKEIEKRIKMEIFIEENNLDFFIYPWIA